MLENIDVVLRRISRNITEKLTVEQLNEIYVFVANVDSTISTYINDNEWDLTLLNKNFS